MNDENKENKSAAYQIPGVIIPEQITDSGTTIGTTDSELKQSIDQNKTVVSNQSKYQSIYQMPGIIIPNQQTDGGKIDAINNVRENDIPKPLEKIKLDTTTPTILPGMPEPPKQELPKKGNTKPQKPKKEGNAKVGCLSIVIIILGIGVLYLAYNTYLKPSTTTYEKDRNLINQVFNKNGYIVGELYSWVNTSGCNSRNNIFYNEASIVNATDLKEEDKNYLAYRVLKQNDFSKKYCSNYPVALNKNDSNQKWYCGEDYLYKNATTKYDDSLDLTYIIPEDKLKEQVEKMFGQGEYKPKTFTIGVNNRYLYDKNTESYILQSTDGEDTCSNYTNSLTSVTEDNTSITLHVKVINKNTNNEIKYNYKFLKSDDGNYYFEELSKGD